MALAIDTRASSSTNPPTSTAQIASFTVNAVSPLVVGVYIFVQSGITVTSVKWNTTEDFGAAVGNVIDTANVNRVEMFVLKNPSTGTHNIDVVLSGSYTNGVLVMFAIGTTGGDTVTGVRTVYTRTDAAGATPGITVVDSQNGDLVFHLAGVYDASITFNAGETTTSTKVDNAGANTESAGLSTKPAVGSSTTVGVSVPAGGLYAEIATAVIPAAAGRTTKNTRSNPLGLEIGMNWRGDL